MLLDRRDGKGSAPEIVLGGRVPGSIEARIEEIAGKQVMLINLKHGLTPGEKMRLTLIFQKSGPMVIEAEGREVNRDISLEHHFMQRSLIDK